MDESFDHLDEWICAKSPKFQKPELRPPLEGESFTSPPFGGEQKPFVKGRCNLPKGSDSFGLNQRSWDPVFCCMRVLPIFFAKAVSLHPPGKPWKNQPLTVDQVKGNSGKWRCFFWLKIHMLPWCFKKDGLWSTILPGSTFELELFYLLFNISRFSFLIMFIKTFKYLSWIVPQQIKYQHLFS